jgi:DNA-binding CsgD family transcriptional regulator/PAS domain-containing protein
VDLDAGDLHTAFSVVQAVHHAPDLDAFPRVVLQELRRIIDYDFGGYNEVDPVARRLVVALDPVDDPRGHQEMIERWASLIDQHPVANYYRGTGDGAAFRISDFLSHDEYHALDLYREVYAPMQCEFQISVALPAPHPLVVAIALNRPDRDFSERDRSVLDLLRPHLVQAYRSAQLRATVESLQRSVELGGAGVLLVEGSGDILVASPRAERLLVSIVRDGRIIDDDVVKWLVDERTRYAARDGGAPVVGSAYRHAVEGPDVLLRFVPGVGGAYDAIVCGERSPYDANRLTALGLTEREGEVLVQLVRGHSTGDIATTLGMQPATVRKHLEHIYTKLGVHDRTAAIAQAIDALLWS